MAVQAFGGDDPMAWANRPKSLAAVRLLASGATRNPELAAILRRHIENGGADCRTDEARNAIRRLAK